MQGTVLDRMGRDHVSDMLFGLLLLVRYWIEIRRMVRAAFYDPENPKHSPAEPYTSLFPQSIRQFGLICLWFTLFGFVLVGTIITWCWAYAVPEGGSSSSLFSMGHSKLRFICLIMLVTTVVAALFCRKPVDLGDEPIGRAPSAQPDRRRCCTSCKWTLKPGCVCWPWTAWPKEPGTHWKPYMVGTGNHKEVFRDCVDGRRAFKVQQVAQTPGFRDEVEDAPVLTKAGVNQAMRKLATKGLFYDYDLEVAMKRFAQSQSKDGKLAMDKDDFHRFFEHFCRRSYLGDLWRVADLLLLDMQFVAEVCLYYVNWPSDEFRSLVHERADGNSDPSWIFTSDKWSAVHDGSSTEQYSYEKIIDDMDAMMEYRHTLRYLCATMLLVQTLLLLQYLIYVDPKLAVIVEAISMVPALPLLCPALPCPYLPLPDLT